MLNTRSLTFHCRTIYTNSPTKTNSIQSFSRMNHFLTFWG